MRILGDVFSGHGAKIYYSKIHGKRLAMAKDGTYGDEEDVVWIEMSHAKRRGCFVGHLAVLLA